MHAVGPRNIGSTVVVGVDQFVRYGLRHSYLATDSILAQQYLLVAGHKHLIGAVLAKALRRVRKSYGPACLADGSRHPSARDS
jgi:hypothetical protein|eukprot:COSAG06_NODE_6169_length_3071_cov_1.593203_3_plen_83_part_00